MRSSTGTREKWKALVEIEAERRRRARQDADRSKMWAPQPGPQTSAYGSDADIIGYGGAAGGGKTDLLLGFAGTKHRRSIIFRRVFPSLRGIIERSRDIYANLDGGQPPGRFNEQTHLWRLPGGRMVEFGAVQYEADKAKHQGQPRDFHGIDEATEFPESIVRFLIGWNRTTTPGQKCRVVLTFNPPMDEAGDWVTRFFAPWLDREHPDPAADGELRWFAMLPDEHAGGRMVEREADGPDPITLPDLIDPLTDAPAVVVPKSRTFFHATLRDNPILARTGYGATIDAMPEPLRSLLKGRFDAARTVNPWQLIPAEWVRAAQRRWREVAEPPHHLTACGLDVAHGGADQTVLAPRSDNYFHRLRCWPGVLTPDGKTAAGLVAREVVQKVPINVDAIGYGASAAERLTDAPSDGGLGLWAIPVNVAEASKFRDKSGRFKCINKRAEMYWRLREALDPENGHDVAMPDDQELLADLCAPRYKIGPSGIQIEAKVDIIGRLGRSPDKGDAVALAMLPESDVGVGTWGADPLGDDWT